MKTAPELDNPVPRVFLTVHRGRVLQALLGLGLVLALASIVAGAGQFALLDRAAAGLRVDEADAVSNDAVYRSIGLGQLAVFLVTAVYWLVWLHRSYANLSAVGVRKTRFTAGWAVGYWFVPIANLWRPYQVMKDLWLRSQSAAARSLLLCEMKSSATRLPGPLRSPRTMQFPLRVQPPLELNCSSKHLTKRVKPTRN